MNEELKIIISAEISKLKQGVENAKKQVGTLQDKISKAKQTIKEDLIKAGEGATNMAKNMAAGFAAAGAALVAAAVSTEEYRNQQAQLKTAFETAGASAEAATTTYNSLYRVLGDGGQATEAAQHLAKLTTEEKALSEYTTALQGVYSVFGSSLPLEGLAEGINHTAKLGEVQGALADALEWSGISVDAYNEQLALCNTEAEREKLIRETLTGLYGEAAANYEANNAQILAQRDAQAALQEKIAAVGTAIAPVITMFSTFATDVLALVIPYIVALAEQHLPTLQTILTGVAAAIGAVINWVVSNWELVSTIATVILSIVAAFTALNMAMKAVDAVMMLFNANPIVLAIAAVIAIIVLCVKYWDEIKAAAGVAWEYIQQAWSNAGAWFKGIVDKIKQAFSNIGAWFKNIFTQARNGVFNAFSTITGFFSGIWNDIKSIFSSVGTAIASGITGAVSSAVNAVLGTGARIINGFIDAINVAIGIINAIPGVNIGYLSRLSVPAMAKGGIVDSATLAVVGEQGKEAVVPLENNLEWLDKLAGMLNDRMGGNQPIVLNVDGKRFAEISVDSINSLTRQRGSIPLVIA